ncbi:hypothetical protein LINGRAHAP2_LOCUS2766, partial [Linum grandiflorum]
LINHSPTICTRTTPYSPPPLATPSPPETILELKHEFGAYLLPPDLNLFKRFQLLNNLKILHPNLEKLTGASFAAKLPLTKSSDLSGI